VTSNYDRVRHASDIVTELNLQSLPYHFRVMTHRKQLYCNTSERSGEGYRRVIALFVTCWFIKQDAQLSQRDRAAGCVIVFAKSRTLELGDND